MRKYKITNGSKNTWYENYNGMVFECAEISNNTSHVEVVKGNFTGRNIRIEDCKPIIDEIPIKNIGHVVYTGRPQEHIGLLPGCQYRIIEIVEDLGYTVLTDDNRKVTLLPENCGTVHLNKYDHVNPDHYKTNDKEVWEYMIEIYGLEKFIAFCELNVFKYSMRVGRKPGATVEDDLGKIKWYAEKIKELRDE
jgi:hypothetical protein